MRIQQQIFVNRKKGRCQVNLVSDKSQRKHLVRSSLPRSFQHSAVNFCLHNSEKLICDLTQATMWLSVITQSDIIVISHTRGGQFKSFKINDSSMLWPIIWWPSDCRAVAVWFWKTVWRDSSSHNMQDGSTQRKELKTIVLIMMCLFLTLPSPSLSCPTT